MPDTTTTTTTPPAATTEDRSSPVTVAIAWLAVGIPLAWGVAQTLIKSLALFQ